MEASAASREAGSRSATVGRSRQTAISSDGNGETPACRSQWLTRRDCSVKCIIAPFRRYAESCKFVIVRIRDEVKRVSIDRVGKLPLRLKEISKPLPVEARNAQ